MKSNWLFVVFMVLTALLAPYQLFIYSSAIGLMFYFLFSLKNLKVIYSDGASIIKPRGDFKFVQLFLLWALINFVRGIFVADGYFEYKHLIIGIASSLLPLLLSIFYFPNKVRFFFRCWLLICVPIVLVLEGPGHLFSVYLLSALVFYVIFLDKWNFGKSLLIIAIVVLYVIVSVQTESRFPIGLFVVTFLFFLLGKTPILENVKLARIVKNITHASVVLVFLVLLPDFFGVFRGEIQSASPHNDSSVGIDSRSLIFWDVYDSSTKHNYVLWGRTPAKGFDMWLSESLIVLDNAQGPDSTKEFGKNWERHINEMALSNIYTWHGLIGLLLFSLIYFKASNLAVKQSQNKYIRLIGCYIAFRWVTGWIADCNVFDMNNIALWSMMAMCYSPYFRNMTNRDFEQWVKKIF